MKTTANAETSPGKLVPFVFALLTLLVHLAVGKGYGYFRDEFYYIACSNHLAWGYVDHPPFSIALLALSRLLLGDSVIAIRIIPYLAGAAVVFITGLMVIDLGGKRLAQLLACIAALIAPIYLGNDTFYSMNALEILFWTLAAYLLIRILKTNDTKLWIVLGIVMGLSLLNKISMLWFGAGLFVGLILTPQRTLLKTRGPWIAGIIAGLLFAPNILWQIKNGWPTLEFMHNATTFKMAGVSPVQFILEQFQVLHPLTFPLTIGALVFYFASKDGKNFRVLGFIFVTVFVLLIVNGKSRAGYLAPAYPMMFAAGATWLDRFISKPAIKISYAVLMILGGMVTAPLALPILPVESYIRYSRALGLKPDTEENKEIGDLPQFFADMQGWDAMEAEVARVFHQLTPQEQANSAIFAQNYGDAGAMELLGRKDQLPDVMSGHNNYWLWGPPQHRLDVVIIIGGDKEDHLQSFESVEPAGMVRCGYCMPYENNQTVFVCRRLKATPAELWPRAKNYD
jgi:Dolichyl-phosphate-mannose-protein mannosyltransferase